MLKLYVFFTFLIVLQTDRASSTRGNAIFLAFRQIFEHKCLKNSNASVTAQMLNAANYLRQCRLENLKPLSAGQTAIDYTCSELRKTDAKCLKLITDNLKPCLEEEESYLPNFILETHDASYEHICKDNGMYFNALDLGQLRECQTVSEDNFEYCLPGSKLVQDFSKPKSVVVRDDLCSNLRDVTKCINDRLKKDCEYVQVLQHLRFLHMSYVSECS